MAGNDRPSGTLSKNTGNTYADNANLKSLIVANPGSPNVLVDLTGASRTITTANGTAGPTFESDSGADLGAYDWEWSDATTADLDFTGAFTAIAVGILTDGTYSDSYEVLSKAIFWDGSSVGGPDGWRLWANIGNGKFAASVRGTTFASVAYGPDQTSSGKQCLAIRYGGGTGSNKLSIWKNGTNIANQFVDEAPAAATYGLRNTKISNRWFRLTLGYIVAQELSDSDMATLMGDPFQVVTTGAPPPPPPPPPPPSGSPYDLIYRRPGSAGLILGRR